MEWVPRGTVSFISPNSDMGRFCLSTSFYFELWTDLSGIEPYEGAANHLSRNVSASFMWPCNDGEMRLLMMDSAFILSSSFASWASNERATSSQEIDLSQLIDPIGASVAFDSLDGLKNDRDDAQTVAHMPFQVDVKAVTGAARAVGPARWKLLLCVLAHYIMRSCILKRIHSIPATMSTSSAPENRRR